MRLSTERKRRSSRQLRRDISCHIIVQVFYESRLSWHRISIICNTRRRVKKLMPVFRRSAGNVSTTKRSAESPFKYGWGFAARTTLPDLERATPAARQEGLPGLIQLCATAPRNQAENLLLASARCWARDDRGTHLSPYIGRFASRLSLAIARRSIMSPRCKTDGIFRPGQLATVGSQPIHLEQYNQLLGAR
jgi:hypothetical protein